jgi:hypothetical protein
VWVKESGKAQTWRDEWRFKNGVWSLDKGIVDTSDAEAMDDHLRQLEAACMFSFAKPMFWHIAFGYQSIGPSVAVTTNPQAVLELLKDRDKTERGRRKSLLHWVRAHDRIRKTGNGDEVVISRVREHLRGRPMVQWRGMWATIYPAADDLSQLETKGAKRFRSL